MSYYSKLVLEVGEVEAKRRMSEVRSHRVQPGHFSKLSKKELIKISRRGGLNRWSAQKENDQNISSGQSV